MSAHPNALSQSLLAALEQAGLGVWMWFPDSDTCTVTGNLRALGDLPLPAHLDGWMALLHPDDAARVRAFLDARGREGQAAFNDELRLRLNAEHWLRFVAIGQWQAAHAGLPAHALFTLRDVTRQRRHEESLKKSEKAYRTLVETSPDAILLLGLDGIVQMANQQAHRLFGLDELRDISETRLHDFLPDDAPASRELLAAFGRPEEFTGIVVSRTLGLHNTAGQRFDAEISFTTIVDDSGRPGGLVFFVRDVTEKMRAADELQRHQTQLEALVHERTHALETAHAALAQILEGSPVPTFVLDADNVVTHWNQACEKIIGTPAQEMVGTRDQWRAFYPEPRPVLADLVMTGSLRTIEEYYGDKFRPSYLIDGAYEAESYFPKSRRWMVFTAAPLKDKQGQIIGAIETMQDVTERKLAEQYLLEAKQLAESAARTKAEFLANMSHEIRTPMNAVIGLAHVLLNTDLAPKQREQVARIRGAGKMLLGLINDILDFSKIEAGRMTLEVTDFNLDELLDGVATVVLNQAQSKGLELNYVVAPDVPHELLGDPLRLSQVFVNLIGNAIKFTERGGVTVHIESQALNDEQIQLNVQIRDTGIGMDKAQQQRLFQAFSQADTSITRKFGGSGLGLTISKRLVELMGGDISVSSTPGQGSTFGFSIVAGVAQAATAALPPLLRNVLIIDDNPLTSTVLARLFAHNGCTPTAVDAVEAALQRLASGERFDGITVDFNLLGAGTQLATTLREAAGPATHVLLVTAHDTTLLDDDTAISGFDEVLNKPVTAVQIRRVVAHLAGAAASPANPPPSAALAGMHVLLAEDIVTNQLIACEMLEALGITVDIAENGFEVLQKLEQGAYDLVLMDVQMPVMDGLEAARRLRADPRWQHLPVVAMTAHAFDEERQRCMAAGMNDFLSKPIDPDVFQATLAHWRTGGAPGAPAATPAAAPETANWPALPGIDTGEGLRRMMNKPALYAKVLKDFYQRFRDETALIRTALATGERETACRCVHSIKGLAGSIGAKALQDAALTLEQAIRNDDAAVDARLGEFAARLQEVTDGLARHYDAP